MPCKTRQAARAGKRSIPHYFLGTKRDRRFLITTSDVGPDSHTDRAELGLQAFEARIDWSTWGASR